MSTEKRYVCESCGTISRCGAPLFEVLLRLTKKTPQPCGKCGDEQHLRLEFDFGLGAGSRACKVLDPKQARS